MKSFIINHMIPSFLIRLFARPYVAGDSIEKGVEKAKQLYKEKGIFSTLDLLVEALKTKEEIEVVVQTYLKLIESISNIHFISVSLKPTSIGIDISKEYCIENLCRILTAALKANVLVTMDMESSKYIDVTLEIYKELKPEFYNFGTVLQTKLFRTEEDIESLKGLDAYIRLCIGAYPEKKDVAFTKNSEMKEKIVEHTLSLLNDGHYVAVATHDEKPIHEILSTRRQNLRIEFQMLLGVPSEKIQNELLNLKHLVRMYIPFATEWKNATNYLKRRLDENPYMFIYIIRNIFSKIF